MDLIKENLFENKSQNLVENSANYEGNETILFYERLQNPEIKKRIADMICEYQETRNPPSQIFRNDENDNLIEEKMHPATIFLGQRRRGDGLARAEEGSGKESARASAFFFGEIFAG